MSFRRALSLSVLALLLLGAGPPPLEPDFLPVAPEGWFVAGKGEGSYTWLRFSASETAEGEDFQDDAITLYRIPIVVHPDKAGGALVETKLRVQEVRESDTVTRTIEGVAWKGFTADYASGAGKKRRERYLFTGHHEGTLYVFWDRGPAATWEAGAPAREEALRTVSAILAGRFEAKPDEGEGAEGEAAESDEGDAPADEAGKDEDT